MNGIIYKVTNSVNGKIYIGQTVYSLKRRKGNHYSSAKRAQHNDRYRNHFINALLYYNKKDFKWEVIDTAVSKEGLNKKEIYWIKEFNTFEIGYNSTTGGDSVLLHRRVKDKISKKAKLRNMGGERNPFYGKKHTKKTRTAIKRKRKFQEYSEETRLKMSLVRRGEKNSQYKKVDEKKFTDLFNEGYSQKEISVKLNIGVNKVRRVYKKLNLSKRHPSEWTSGKKHWRFLDLPEGKIIEEYTKTDINIGKLAEKYNCSVDSLRRIFKKNNILLKKPIHTKEWVEKRRTTIKEKNL